MTRLLKGVKGVVDVKVNFSEKKATITGDNVDKKALVKVINDTENFKATLVN